MYNKNLIAVIIFCRKNLLWILHERSVHCTYLIYLEDIRKSKSHYIMVSDMT